MNSGKTPAAHESPRASAARPVHPARTTLVDATAAELRARIAAGEWPVGAKIPVEHELVDLVGVGRNTIREAIATLVHAGLLSREQGRGTFVTHPSAAAAADDAVDAAAAAAADGSGTAAPSPVVALVSRAERRDALQLRSALDLEAARIAAATATAADVAELRRLRDERAASWRSGDLAARIAADTALHRAVIAITGNTLFVELYDGLLALFEAVLVEDVQGDTDAHAHQHHEMVEAIAAGEADRAVAALESLLLPLRRGAGE